MSQQEVESMMGDDQGSAETVQNNVRKTSMRSEMSISSKDEPPDGRWSYQEVAPLVWFMTIFGVYHHLHHPKTPCALRMLSVAYSLVIMALAWMLFLLNLSMFYKATVSFDVFVVIKVSEAISAFLTAANVVCLFWMSCRRHHLPNIYQLLWKRKQEEDVREHTLRPRGGVVLRRKIYVTILLLMGYFAYRLSDDIKGLSQAGTPDSMFMTQLYYPYITSPSGLISAEVTSQLLNILCVVPFFAPFIFFVHVCLLVKEEFVLFNRKLRRTILEEANYAIEDLRQEYEALGEMVAALNRCFNVFISVNVAVNIPYLCFLVYAMIAVIGLQFISLYHFVCLCLLTFTSICVAPGTIRTAAMLPAAALQKLDLTNLPQDAVLQTQVFMARVYHNTPSMTVMGMFAMDRALVLKVYGTILTYVILVVKFGMSKKGGVSVFSKDIMDRLTGSNDTIVN